MEGVGTKQVTVRVKPESAENKMHANFYFYGKN